MANARGRLKEEKSARRQGRGRPKKSSLKDANEIESKVEQNLKLSRVLKTKSAEKISLSSSDCKEKPINETLPTKSTKLYKPRAVRKNAQVKQHGKQKKTMKKNTIIESQENLVDILAKELTKAVQKKISTSPPDREPEEPRIITMKPSSAGLEKNPSHPIPPPLNKETEAIQVSSNTETTSDSVASPPTEYTTIEQDGKTWTVPKLLKPSEYNLVLPVDEHRDEKIADINVLRRMLQQPKVQLSNGIQISIPNTMSAIFECDHCSKMFRTKQDLRKHMLIHLNQRPHACTVCVATFRQRGNLRTHMSRLHAALLPSLQQYICDHCGARFYVKESIRAHLLKHESTRAHSCEQCGKSFARAQLLDAHKRSQHGEPRFYCYLCSASYPTRVALDSHIKRHLNVTRDLTCVACGEVFPGIASMKRHMEMRHYGAKRFQCPVCSKQLKGHMREHLRTHASSKPYACLECGKRFAQTSQLAVHKRSHTGLKPYVCRVCKRPFTHSNALILHIRIHTGEKPFECAMCPQTFSQLPHMKAHMLSIHNKREAYKCEDCGEFFKLRAALEKHRVSCPRATPWLHDLPAPPPHKDAPTMSLTKMRFLLAILLQTIADQHRLNLLGFNKRLIDELLVDSLQAMGHTPSTDPRTPAAVRLRDNIQQLLNWTVPADVMQRYRQQNKSTEELLEELTS